LTNVFTFRFCSQGLSRNIYST